MPTVRTAVWSCIRPGRTAPDHSVRPCWSLIVVVLIVFCLRLPETKARRPGWCAFGAAGLGLGAVDPQCDVLGRCIGEHVRQGPRPNTRPARHREPTLGQQRADLADRAADGGGAHLVDHSRCLVRQAGSQVDNDRQGTVGEDQFVLRSGPGLPSASALASFAPNGLTTSLPAWREFFDQLAQVLAREATEGRMRHGCAGLLDVHTTRTRAVGAMSRPAQGRDVRPAPGAGAARWEAPL
jgi:hypothetical protein